MGDVASLPIDRADNTYQLVDNFSLVRGVHTLKAGAEVRVLQLNGYVEVYSRGQMNFNGALTGSGIGDLLVGLPTLDIQSKYTGPQTLRSKSLSGYFQDDWKVTRKLTLNPGLRYEYDSPATDPTNRMATFDFKTGTVEQVGTNGLSRSGTLVRTRRLRATSRICLVSNEKYCCTRRLRHIFRQRHVRGEFVAVLQSAVLLHIRVLPLRRHR